MARHNKEIPICNCGLRAMLKTSWTDWNPERRCVVFPQKDGKRCGFWEWYDPEICARATQVILGLLRRINRMENKMEMSEVEDRKCECKAKTEKLQLKVSKLEAEVSKLKMRNKTLLKALLITWMLICLAICCVYVVNDSGHGQILATKGD